MMAWMTPATLSKKPADVQSDDFAPPSQQISARDLEMMLVKLSGLKGGLMRLTVAGPDLICSRSISHHSIAQRAPLFSLQEADEAGRLMLLARNWKVAAGDLRDLFFSSYECAHSPSKKAISVATRMSTSLSLTLCDIDPLTTETKLDLRLPHIDDASSIAYSSCPPQRTKGLTPSKAAILHAHLPSLSRPTPMQNGIPEEHEMVRVYSPFAKALMRLHNEGYANHQPVALGPELRPRMQFKVNAPGQRGHPHCIVNVPGLRWRDLPDSCRVRKMDVVAGDFFRQLALQNATNARIQAQFETVPPIYSRVTGTHIGEPNLLDLNPTIQTLHTVKEFLYARPINKHQLPHLGTKVHKAVVRRSLATKYLTPKPRPAVRAVTLHRRVVLHSPLVHVTSLDSSEEQFFIPATAAFDNLFASPRPQEHDRGRRGSTNRTPRRKAAKSSHTQSVLPESASHWVVPT